MALDRVDTALRKSLLPVFTGIYGNVVPAEHVTIMSYAVPDNSLRDKVLALELGEGVSLHDIRAIDLGFVTV